ncbi:uncharacterized protein LOC129601979 [Paramacrobiotus metropolitanus]|uniref:uncharacterized protein LOC129601979 n=1 Tax=Paramacrobiotus metropolitanus TaxID=2943436 RepID=UPI002445C6C2|nr:uncharacterized protein LOC129601979 [Paramacrobiotus metropolitanus]
MSYPAFPPYNAPPYNQPSYNNYSKPASPVYNQPPVNHGPQPYAPPNYAVPYPASVGLDTSPYGTNRPYDQCGFPNAVRGLRVDPFKIAGIWYGYNSWFINATQDVPQSKDHLNVINYYTNLATCHFPTTDIPCVVMTQEQTYTDRISGTCQGFHEVSHFTEDGRQTGPYFDRRAAGLAIPAGLDNSIVLAMDYESYAVYHSCSKYSSRSRLCADPYLYTYTRRKPNQISAEEKRRIDEAVSNAVKPFCFDPRQFIYYGPWNDTLAACPRTPGSDCYQTMKAAYASTIEISTLNT